MKTQKKRKNLENICIYKILQKQMYHVHKYDVLQNLNYSSLKIYFRKFFNMNQKFGGTWSYLESEELEPKTSFFPNLIATTFSGRVHPFDHC
jgi:hypothetical protein